jgi:hypothetical protein
LNFQRAASGRWGQYTSTHRLQSVGADRK